MKEEARSPLLLLAAAFLFVAAPAVAQEAESAAGAVVGAVELPRDLSPVGMFLNADLLVKAVIIGLVFASVLTWTVWLAKTLEIVAARRRLRAGLRSLASARTLADAVGAGGPVRDFIEAATLELSLSNEAGALAGVKERVASRLDGIEIARARRLNRGTGVLATIGATAPFVGLFGTVWGIMNSFIGIAKAHTTNLAVVAPGIAEALLATAFGLAAAIPAVVVYNLFSRQLAGYRAQLAEASAEVARLASRDVDRLIARRGSAETRRFAAAAE